MAARLLDLGLSPYGEAHALQLQCVADLLHGGDETVIVTEHGPVFTLGKNADTSCLLKSEMEIEAAGVELVSTERGGSITYHGPGQLVLYPIVDLRRRRLAVGEFIHLLEEVMIGCAADFGVAAERDSRNRGVWVGDDKLGSIGIRVRRGISFHGLALNVDLQTEHFSWIQPCGLGGVGVTSLARVCGQEVDVAAAKRCLLKHFISHFGEVHEYIQQA